MMKRIAVLAALFVSLLFAVPINPPPAQAAPIAIVQAAPPANCAQASVCGYADIDYRTGFGYEFIPVLGAGRYDNVGLNDRWSSMFNNSGRTIYLYKNANCPAGQETLRFPNGTGTTSFSWDYTGWNDKVSCVKFG